MEMNLLASSGLSGLALASSSRWSPFLGELPCGRGREGVALRAELSVAPTGAAQYSVFRINHLVGDAIG